MCCALFNEHTYFISISTLLTKYTIGMLQSHILEKLTKGDLDGLFPTTLETKTTLFALLSKHGNTDVFTWELISTF